MNRSRESHPIVPVSDRYIFLYNVVSHLQCLSQTTPVFCKGTAKRKCISTIVLCLAGTFTSWCFHSNWTCCIRSDKSKSQMHNLQGCIQAVKSQQLWQSQNFPGSQKARLHSISWISGPEMRQALRSIASGLQRCYFQLHLPSLITFLLNVSTTCCTLQRCQIFTQCPDVLEEVVEHEWISTCWHKVNNRESQYQSCFGFNQMQLGSFNQWGQPFLWMLCRLVSSSSGSEGVGALKMLLDTTACLLNAFAAAISIDSDVQVVQHYYLAKQELLDYLLKRAIHLTESGKLRKLRQIFATCLGRQMPTHSSCQKRAQFLFQSFGLKRVSITCQMPLKEDFTRIEWPFAAFRMSICAGQFEKRAAELLESIEALAEVHSAYPQLMDIAQWLQDPDKLYTYMLELGRVDNTHSGPMMDYVFSRLLTEGRVGELLDLPSQFDTLLGFWLQNQVWSYSCPLQDCCFWEAYNV